MEYMYGVEKIRNDALPLECGEFVPGGFPVLNTVDASTRAWESDETRARNDLAEEYLKNMQL